VSELPFNVALDGDERLPHRSRTAADVAFRSTLVVSGQLSKSWERLWAAAMDVA
jgi:hypothetical protein